ncbi:hypothetical protein K2X40_05435 [Candidatus Babeliales bacterium]|nr:hypothetical protein [Candidatus Babeliales bacterium]
MKQARKRTFLVAFLMALVPTIFWSDAHAKQEKRDIFSRAKKGVTVIDGSRSITYGSVIRLWHYNSDPSKSAEADPERRYLASGEEKYNTGTTDRGYAVYAAQFADDNSQLWVIKGPHAGDRWNCDFGQLVKEGDAIRLENVGTGRNLFIPATRFRSPVAKQTEVSVHGENGVGDANDTWIVRNTWAGSGGVLNDGTVFNLQHGIFDKLSLHSNPFKKGNFILGDKNKQEVTGFQGCDSNSDWVLDLVKTHAQNETIAADWQKMRGAELHYNSIVWIDPVGSGLAGYQCDPKKDNGSRINLNENNRRLWTHHASRQDPDAQAVAPYAHKEILAGPLDDARVRMAAGFFLLQKSGDEKNAGPVSFGDSIKVFSLAIDPFQKLNTVLDPFKIWYVNKTSRFGNDYGEIIVADPTLPEAQTPAAEFTIEMVVPDMAGTVYETDMIQLRSKMQDSPPIWLNAKSRFGDRYYELSVALTGDLWAANDSSYKNSRAELFHRFRIHGIIESIVPEEVKPQLAQIKSIIERNLGSTVVNDQQAELDRQRQAQEEAARQAAADLAQKAAADKQAADDKQAKAAAFAQILKDLEAQAEQDLADASAKAADTKAVQDLIQQATKDLLDAKSVASADQMSLLKEAQAIIIKVQEEFQKIKDTTSQIFDDASKGMIGRFNAASDKAKQDYGVDSQELASIKALLDKEQDRFAKAKLASQDGLKVQEDQIQQLVDTINNAVEQGKAGAAIAAMAAQAEQARKQLIADYDQRIADIDKKAEERFAKLQADFDQQKKDSDAQLKAAQDQLAAAQKGFDQERARLEAAAKKPLDVAKVEAQQKVDTVVAVVEQSAAHPEYPLGFADVPGNVAQIAVGKRKNANGKLVGNNWAVAKDGSLLQWKAGADNPWMVHVAKDNIGNDIKTFLAVSSGHDGTVLAVTADGAVVRYNWPNEKAVDTQPADETVQTADTGTQSTDASTQATDASVATTEPAATATTKKAKAKKGKKSTGRKVPATKKSGKVGAKKKKTGKASGSKQTTPDNQAKQR